MHGNIFVCHGETTNPTQYSETIEQLSRHASNTYKCGEDIQGLIRNLEPTIVFRPERLKVGDANSTNMHIWEKHVGIYVKTLNLNESNTKHVYSVVWNQWSPSLQAKMETLEDYKSLVSDIDFFNLLQEIRSSVHRFESLTYIHESIFKAKEEMCRMEQRGDE